MVTMIIKAILMAALFVFIPCAYGAGNSGKLPMAMDHGGHDLAPMDGMMGKGDMGKPDGWTSYPMLKTRVSGDARKQTLIMAVPQNILAGSIDAYSNNLKDENAHRQLAMSMAGAPLDTPASGGFHWLSVREEQGDRVSVASAIFSFAGGGAKDPTAMFMQQKHELEIIPQPYPREHSRYRADESWKFLVRFNGNPLPNQKVVLETQNRTRSEWVSDAQGLATVYLPDDFKREMDRKETGEPRRGMQGMQGSDFVLATEYSDSGKTYLTAFNGSYGKNAYDKRSLAMGLGFTLLGMMGAAPLLRQRKSGQKNPEAGNV
jgi:hypothetical protein